MEKVLTVSIAAYNVADYLSQTLDSLICEEVMDKLEVIIVNDGSKDNTAQVAQRYVDMYPNTFKLINKENGGWGSTINESSKVAKGKYYKLLDGDDWFETDNLPEFIRLLENSETDLVFTQYTKCFEPDMQTQLIESPYSYFDKHSTAEIYDCIMHVLSVKTALLQKGNFEITENCFYTDVEFFLKCVQLSNDFCCYPVNIYCYRLGRAGQSVSVAGSIKHFAEHEYIVNKATAIIEANVKFERFLKEGGYLTLLRNHLQRLLIMTPNCTNYKKFVLFKKKYIKKYSWIKKNFQPYEKLVVEIPVLYFLCVWLKRKKHNITI